MKLSASGGQHRRTYRNSKRRIKHEKIIKNFYVAWNVANGEKIQYCITAIKKTTVQPATYTQ